MRRIEVGNDQVLKKLVAGVLSLEKSRGKETEQNRGTREWLILKEDQQAMEDGSRQDSLDHFLGRVDINIWRISSMA